MESDKERAGDLMPSLTYGNLRAAVQRRGYPFFDHGDYNLNLIGLRTNDQRSELFNDWLIVAYRQNDYPQMLAFPITTDPGLYYRENPCNVKGAAIVVPGHYPKLWQIGKHKGQYDALVQHGSITVYRDNNRDTVLDCDALTAVEGGFGINLHKAGYSSKVVGKWSAGCQVFQQSADFDYFMALARRSAISWGGQFSYTLLTEQEIWRQKT